MVSAVYAQHVLASLRATTLLVAVWCLLSTLEWVANLGMFKAEGLLSWRILSLRRGLIFRSDRAKSLFWERSILFVLSVRIVSALALIVTADVRWACVGLFVIAVTSWFLTVRTWLGSDGADQIGQIASIGALLIAAGIAFGDLGVSFAGTLLVAGQLVISYFYAGLSKLLSPEWRRGRALVGVMGTHSYGHRLAAGVFGRSRTLGVVACWFVIMLEMLFPLVLFAPHAVLFPVLAGFLLFHLSHAYFMGLNTFAWAFATAYPSFVVLSHITTRALGWS